VVGEEDFRRVGGLEGRTLPGVPEEVTKVGGLRGVAPVCVSFRKTNDSSTVILTSKEVLLQGKV